MEDRMGMVLLMMMTEAKPKVGPGVSLKESRPLGTNTAGDEDTDERKMERKNIGSDLVSLSEIRTQGAEPQGVERFSKVEREKPGSSLPAQALPERHRATPLELLTSTSPCSCSLQPSPL